ncbi:MAG: peptide chain release factor N(5)-glutamine methyltransferase [bacterium]
MSDIWTIQRILEWTTDFFRQKQLESPKLEAELLLSHVLKLNRVQLYMHWDRPLVPSELEAYRAVVKRRAMKEPVAYITGERAFWTIELKCDARALIPRNDTETLVEKALDVLGKDSAATVVDVGTGTGVVGLTLAKERPALAVTLVDISDDALALAAENTEALGLTDRVTLLKSDVLAAVPGPVDLIVSNPPYIAESETDVMGEDVLKFEPKLALFAGKDGLDVIRRLVVESYDRLKPGGHLLFEIGYRQGVAAAALTSEAGFANVRVFKDLGGNDRVVCGQRA